MVKLSGASSNAFPPSGPEGIGSGLRKAICLPCIAENCVRFEEMRSEKMILPCVVEHSTLPLKVGGSMREMLPCLAEQTISVLCFVLLNY